MMRNDVKLGLYAVLLILACVFGVLAASTYKRVNSQTTETPATNAPEATSVLKADGQRVSSGYGKVFGYGGVFFISVLGLGLLVGHDVSHFIGNRVLKGAYNDEGEGMSNPEYEQAEQVWADGQHLEAIGLMREYLQKNPREQHVALRIAEIYEKDLLNPLAAALEYEEVLKHRLSAERWGWAAIHLCNLYSKLNEQDKVIALLRRIHTEYGTTAAAEKARKRLEDLGVPLESDEVVQEADAAPDPPPATRPQLPPGFKLKKG
jgi:hypothetical protein